MVVFLQASSVGLKYWNTVQLLSETNSKIDLDEVKFVGCSATVQPQHLKICRGHCKRKALGLVDLELRRIR